MNDSTITHREYNIDGGLQQRMPQNGTNIEIVTPALPFLTYFPRYDMDE
jgi:hypothetical protein